MGARQSGPRICHFNGLAADEVQTIMQLLDTTSLLRLARCSHRLHADSNSNAAWRTHSPFELKLNPGSGTLIAQHFPRSLVSHVAAIRIGTRKTRQSNGRMIPHLLAADIDAMLTLPHITELNDGEWKIPADEWSRILHDPAMAGLTMIKATRVVPWDIIRQLAHLPRLHTLKFTARMVHTLYDGPQDEVIDVTALPSLPALTSLNVTSIDDITDSALLVNIAECAQLKRLRLAAAHFHEGDLSRLLTSPNMVRLQELVLVHFDAQMAPEEFAEVFTAMTHLRHLDLQWIWNIDSLLSGVPRAPHLATVMITGTHSGPSVAALQSLLTQTEASRVHVTLRPGWGVNTHPFAAINSHRFTLLPALD